MELDLRYNSFGSVPHCSVSYKAEDVQKGVQSLVQKFFFNPCDESTRERKFWNLNSPFGEH